MNDLIPIVLFLSMFASLYVFLTTRNKERLALIEKGGDPSLFKYRDANSGYVNFKYGLFFIGVALGIMAGYFLTEAGMDEGPAYFAMIFLFGGIGLIVSFLLQSKFEKR